MIAGIEQLFPCVELIQLVQRLDGECSRDISVTQEIVRSVVDPQVVRAEVLIGGLKGDKGDPGVSGDLNYVHSQPIPSATWVVVHGLGKFPSVTVVDSGKNVVVGDIKFDSINQCTLTFAGAFSGSAFVN